MKSLLKTFKYLQPYKGKLFAAFFLLIISTVFNLVQPRLSEYAIDNGISMLNSNVVVFSALLLLFFGLLGSIFNYYSGLFVIKSSLGMSYDLRNALFKKISSFSFADFDKWRTGELMVRINSDVNTVQQFVRMGLFILVISILMLIGAIIGMYLIDSYLATILSVSMIGILGLFFAISQIIRPFFKKIREALDKLNNVAQENLAGAKLVRAFARQKEEIQKFDIQNKNFYSISIKVGNLMSFVMPLLMVIGNYIGLLAIWLGGLEVATGNLTLGELVAFNNYASMAVFPILMLAMVLNFISMAMASADRINELNDVQPTIIDCKTCINLEKLSGKIEFKNVSLKYGEGEDALHDINLEIKPGEKIGIIGTTGSGKSSLIHLISRFYDTTEGNIFIDDIDIKDLSLETIRGRINIALQDTYLFSGTIADNIRFGKPECDIIELQNVAKYAVADEFIDEKEFKFDEILGVRGTGLSGGQRQRIAIARALMAKPDILILDDVTSSLDITTESKVIENIYKSSIATTTIIISQKINAVKRADRIIVMDKGKIEEIGTHEQLIKNSKIYTEIFMTQNSATIES